jgi:hypothetical protein
MRIRLALAALLGAFALLWATGAPMALAAQTGAPHHASSKVSLKAKKKGKRGKKKHKKRKATTKPTKSVPSVKLTGGSATIALSSTAASALEKAKVTLTATAPATLPAASQVSMPITGGTLNPGTGEGTVDLGGSFTFLGPEVNLYLLTTQSAVSLESPVVIKLAGSNSNLSANVGSPPLDAPFFALKAGKPTSSGGTLTLDGITASLNSPAAEVMSRAFGSGSFTTGETVASISLSASTASAG